jgi:gluconolactonase
VSGRVALRKAAALLLGAAASLCAADGGTPAPQDAPSGPPEATIDLTTSAGVALVRGQWRYSDTTIVETELPGPGADNQPTGALAKTYDYEPHAGGADFDDSKWDAVAPDTLAVRRGHGRLGFNWYRITVTVPERIGSYDPSGKDVVLEATLDDAAEVWVDGELTRYLGQRGGSVAAGWNAPNRLVVGRSVRPGQKIAIAIFGINGPLSNPPTNFIYVRTARLELYPGAGPIAITPAEVNVRVDRVDPALDAIVGPNPKMWKVAEGFSFTEGTGLASLREVAPVLGPQRQHDLPVHARRLLSPGVPPTVGLLREPTSPSTVSPARTGSRSIRAGR